MKDGFIVYLSGPITGVENFFNNFAAAERRVKGMGYPVVLNPATIPAGLRQEDYMRICHAMLDAADIIVMLDGWQRSNGAHIERELAFYTGKDVYDIGDLPRRKRHE